MATLYMTIAFLHFCVWAKVIGDAYNPSLDTKYELIGRAAIAVLWSSVWPIMSFVCGLIAMYNFACMKDK